MKCPKCKKDFQAGIEAAYGLGVLKGEEGATLERKTQIKLNNMRATNHALLRELNQMDKKCPRDDCRVWLSRDFVKRLIVSFRKYGGFHRAKQLKKIMRDQIKTSIKFDSKGLK